ncbi:MAG: GspH/FimT family pseudopilin [Betaproteobacteria bacterium]|nr:GspH/FimT family pseudopilin [Betaproteobacteria bacterium]
MKRTLSTHIFRSTHPEGRTRGFTLTELLIVIAIAAILAALAVPSFKTVIRNMAVRNAADDLVADIQYARSEAVRTNRTVSLTLDERTWHVRDDNNNLLREGTYSDLINAQVTALSLGFSPTGTTTLTVGSFPTGICLTAGGDPPIQRQVLLPARASSPVIQAACN